MMYVCKCVAFIIVIVRDTGNRIQKCPEWLSRVPHQSHSTAERAITSVWVCRYLFRHFRVYRWARAAGARASADCCTGCHRCPLPPTTTSCMYITYDCVFWISWHSSESVFESVSNVAIYWLLWDLLCCLQRILFHSTQVGKTAIVRQILPDVFIEGKVKCWPKIETNKPSAVCYF
jgi:hypothetical protein